MFAMLFLEEGPNASLAWLFYVLLAFLALVVIVGALTGREEPESPSKSQNDTQAVVEKQIPPGRVKRPSIRRKSK